jgi:hypothetical protein
MKTLSLKKKRAYVAPKIEVFPIEPEGILAGSSVSFDGQIGGKDTEEGTLGGGLTTQSPFGAGAQGSETVTFSL